MKTRKKIQKGVLKNCVEVVFLREMKAKTIHQSNHKTNVIYQWGHKADVIEGGHISINEMTLEEAEKKFNIKIVK